MALGSSVSLSYHYNYRIILTKLQSEDIYVKIAGHASHRWLFQLHNWVKLRFLYSASIRFAEFWKIQWVKIALQPGVKVPLFHLSNFAWVKTPLFSLALLRSYQISLSWVQITLLSPAYSLVSNRRHTLIKHNMGPFSTFLINITYSIRVTVAKKFIFY